MYTDKNFKTKKALKEAVTAWNASQAGASVKALPVTYFQPGPFGGNEPSDGTIYVEGPHYPEPHKWYAQCTVKGGVVVGVK
jgi:hypothetical protein